MDRIKSFLTHIAASKGKIGEISVDNPVFIKNIKMSKFKLSDYQVFDI